MLSLLFSFNGRIGRSQYWLATIAVNLFNWFVLFASTMTTSAPVADKNPVVALSALSSQMAILVPLSLAVTWSALALQVKRFHDRGQSGWWTLLPLAPCVFMLMNVFTAVFEQWPPERLLGSLGLPFLALVIISIGFFINLGCLAGTDGPNKYGDPPGGGLFSPGGAPHAPSGKTSAAKASAAFLGSAEQAMERAIAEAARQPAPRPQMVHAAMPQPAMARAPVASPGFGRKPAR